MSPGRSTCATTSRIGGGRTADRPGFGYNALMTELVYHKDYTVHTYETDARGVARPVALLNYLQDSAGDHAGRLGLSVVDLFKRGLTWVLSRYHVVVHRYPAMGDRLEVTTWPSGKRGHFATRDFEVADGGRRAGPLGDVAPGWSSTWPEADRSRSRTSSAPPTPSRSGPSTTRSLRSPSSSARDSEIRFRVEASPSRLEPPRQQRGLCPMGARGRPAGRPDRPPARRPRGLLPGRGPLRRRGPFGGPADRRARAPGPCSSIRSPTRRRAAELARLRTRWE